MDKKNFFRYNHLWHSRNELLLRESVGGRSVNTLSILDNIKVKLSLLTNSQQKAADYIINNPMSAAFSTISELSASAGVSTNTVVRLTERLGYSGYSRFQSDLRNYVKSVNTQNSSEVMIETEELRKNDNFKRTVFDVTALELDNIKQTYRNIDPNQLEKAVQTIHNAERIFLCGTGNCNCVVNTLFINMNKMLSKPITLISTNAVRAR